MTNKSPFASTSLVYTLKNRHYIFFGLWPWSHPCSLSLLKHSLPQVYPMLQAFSMCERKGRIWLLFYMYAYLMSNPFSLFTPHPHFSGIYYWPDCRSQVSALQSCLGDLHKETFQCNLSLHVCLISTLSDQLWHCALTARQLRTLLNSQCLGFIHSSLISDLFNACKWMLNPS